MTRIATILLVFATLMFSSYAAIAHPDNRSKIKRGGLPARVAALAERVENMSQHDLSLFEASLSQIEQSAQLIKQLCDGGARLTLCPSRDVKRVFVTSTVHTGNVPGVSAADMFCNIRAQAGGHNGYFKAWISDSPDTDPESTFTRSQVPYALPDGTIIANDWDDLTDGVLSTPIDVDENGQVIGSPPLGIFNVWTSTDHRGEHHLVSSNQGPVGLDCDNWFATDSSTTFGDQGVPLGLGGFTNSSGKSWTLWQGDLFDLLSNKSSCSLKRRLYCFEQ